MSDRKGDPAKQPPDCEPRFTPSARNPRIGVWSQCPNLRETSSNTDMDGETYHCDVCGKHYRLYYEEMS